VISRKSAVDSQQENGTVTTNFTTNDDDTSISTNDDPTWNSIVALLNVLDPLSNDTTLIDAIDSIIILIDSYKVSLIDENKKRFIIQHVTKLMDSHNSKILLKVSAIIVKVSFMAMLLHFIVALTLIHVS